MKVTNLWKQWPLFVDFSSVQGQAFLMLPYLWSEIHRFMISGCSYQNPELPIRAGGQGFPLATMSVGPATFIGK